MKLSFSRFALVSLALITSLSCQQETKNTPASPQVDEKPQTPKAVYVRVDTRTQKAEYTVSEQLPTDSEKQVPPQFLKSAQWSPVPQGTTLQAPGVSDTEYQNTFYFVRDGQNMKPVIDEVKKYVEKTQPQYTSNTNNYWYGGYGNYCGYPYYGYNYYYWPGYYNYYPYSYYPYNGYNPYYYSSYYYWPSYYYGAYWYYQPYYYWPTYGYYNYYSYYRWW